MQSVLWWGFRNPASSSLLSRSWSIPTVWEITVIAHFAIRHQVSQALAFCQVGHRLRERNIKQRAGRDRTVAVMN